MKGEHRFHEIRLTVVRKMEDDAGKLSMAHSFRNDEIWEEWILSAMVKSFCM